MRAARPPLPGAALLAVALALCFAGPAPPLLAFESVRTEPNLTGFRKIGGMYWKPALWLRNAGYEDNIFLATDSRADSDFTATLAPEAEFVAMVRDRATIRARPALFYTAFAEHTEQNFFGGSATARADLFLNDWSFYADAGYLTTRQRPGDEIDLRPRRVIRRLALGSRFEHAQRLALDLQAAQDETEFRDDSPEGVFSFRDRLNRTERAARVTFAYRAGRKTDLVLEAEGREYDFTGEEALTQDARARRILGGIDWEPVDAVRLRLRAGNLRLEPESDLGQDFDGLAGSASLRLRVSQRVILTLDGDRDLFISSFADNLFAVANRGALRLLTLMSRKAGAEVGGELARVRYSDERQAPQPRRDRVSRAYVGALYKISERTSAGVRLTRFERESNLDSQDRDLTVISGTFGYFF